MCRIIKQNKQKGEKDLHTKISILQKKKKKKKKLIGF